MISSEDDDGMLALDVAARQRVVDDEVLLRTAAAASLLRVAIRAADMLPIGAYASLAMMAQDPSERVRGPRSRALS